MARVFLFIYHSAGKIKKKRLLSTNVNLLRIT